MASLRPSGLVDPNARKGPLPMESLGAMTNAAPLATSMHAPAATGPNINWGNAVSDPAEQQRILGLATDMVNRNEAGSGLGVGSYAPGYSRDRAIADAAYSFFPGPSGGGGGGGTGAAGSAGTPTFTGTAPKPTPYGDFVAPDPASLASDPYTQFRLSEGQRGMEHGAASRGTLLSGGLLRSLERYRQGVASEEGQNLFNRSLAAYTTNRDTNAQNYGQQHTSYGDTLAGFGANLDAARLGLSRDQFDYGKSRDALADQQTQADRDADANANRQRTYADQINQTYAQQVQAARNAALAPPPPPGATNYLPFRYRESRPGIR